MSSHVTRSVSCVEAHWVACSQTLYFLFRDPRVYGNRIAGDLVTSSTRGWGWGKEEIDISFSFSCSALVLMLQACTLTHARSYIFENNVCVHTGYSWRVRPYIAESENVALAIGKWKLSIWEYRAYCNDLLECPPNNSLPVCNSQCPKQP